MRVDTDREHIKQLLADKDIPAKAVEARNTRKLADLTVTFANQRVLIGVDSKDRNQQRQCLTQQEKGATRSPRIDRVGDRLHHSWKQLRDFPYRQNSDNTLMWLFAGDRAALLSTGRAARTLLYGIEDLEGYTLDGEFYSKPCYFMYQSIFFRERQLDAVVIHRLGSLELCLNPYSSRYETFRGSPFVEALKCFTQLIDPVQEERESRAFIADYEIDRRDANAVFRCVVSKYRLGRPEICRSRLFSYPA